MQQARLDAMQDGKDPIAILWAAPPTNLQRAQWVKAPAAAQVSAPATMAFAPARKAMRAAAVSIQPAPRMSMAIFAEDPVKGRAISRQGSALAPRVLQASHSPITTQTLHAMCSLMHRGHFQRLAMWALLIL